MNRCSMGIISEEQRRGPSLGERAILYASSTYFVIIFDLLLAAFAAFSLCSLFFQRVALARQVTRNDVTCFLIVWILVMQEHILTFARAHSASSLLVATD